MSDAPHSQLYFTDARDHWWYDDYVALLAKRFGLGAAKRVLDVGAGQGHFARLWAPHLAPAAELTLVDREARSLAVAQERATPHARWSFVRASADALPFPDDTFDLVTCQTLLIHVPDPAAVVAEMTRVVKRGGRVLAAEPNNAIDVQRIVAHGPEASSELAERHVRMMAHVLRGKVRLGLGWNDLGVHLPRYFGGLRDVRYYVNDRPWILAPPYDDPSQRATIADFETYERERIWGWPRDEARRYYVAGGGDAAAFDAEYDWLLAAQSEEVAAMRRGTWCELGAVALFVACGVKP